MVAAEALGVDVAEEAAEALGADVAEEAEAEAADLPVISDLALS